MKISDVIIGEEVYYPALGKRLFVFGKDIKSEYVFCRDNEQNILELHCSRLESIDWGADTILKREG